MSPGNEKAPRGCTNNHARGGYNSNTQKKGSTQKHAGQNFNVDHLRLPSPASYYSMQFPGISTNRKLVKVICPFHDDTRPSLSINLEEGWYKCHACGEGGGGITKFHMTKFSLTYKQTIKELEAFSAR
jgi:hypothetical protein